MNVEALSELDLAITRARKNIIETYVLRGTATFNEFGEPTGALAAALRDARHDLISQANAEEMRRRVKEARMA